MATGPGEWSRRVSFVFGRAFNHHKFREETANHRSLPYVHFVPLLLSPACPSSKRVTTTLRVRSLNWVSLCERERDGFVSTLSSRGFNSQAGYRPRYPREEWELARWKSRVQVSLIFAFLFYRKESEDGWHLSCYCNIPPLFINFTVLSCLLLSSSLYMFSMIQVIWTALRIVYRF